MLSIFALKKLCAFHTDVVQPHCVASLCPDICLIEILEKADCRLPTMINGRIFRRQLAGSLHVEMITLMVLLFCRIINDVGGGAGQTRCLRKASFKIIVNVNEEIK